MSAMKTHLSGWQKGDKCSFHLSEEVHVWKIHLKIDPEEQATLWKYLNSEEQKRANRFHFEKDRLAYIAVRGHLRELLSRYLKINAADLRFDYNPYGKPFLKEYSIEFNVSHSNQWGLIALDSRYPLGVDVEWMRPDFAGLKIARRFFSARETEELKRLPDELQEKGFFNGWTRKEAYIKARGEGLHIALNSFDVTLSPGEEPRLLSTRREPQDYRNWRLYALSIAKRYAAALMVSRRRTAIRLFSL